MANSLMAPSNLRRGLSGLGLLAVVGALAVSLAASGCGSSNHHRRARERPEQTEEGNDDDAKDIVYFEHDLDEDDPAILNEFEGRAQAYGCETARKPQNVVAKCPEGPIVLVKQELHLTIGCKGISLGECKELFKHIVEAKGGPARE
jgi:hypothetical protein